MSTFRAASRLSRFLEVLPELSTHLERLCLAFAVPVDASEGGDSLDLR